MRIKKKPLTKRETEFKGAQRGYAKINVVDVAIEASGQRKRYLRSLIEENILRFN